MKDVQGTGSDLQQMAAKCKLYAEIYLNPKFKEPIGMKLSEYLKSSNSHTAFASEVAKLYQGLAMHQAESGGEKIRAAAWSRMVNILPALAEPMTAVQTILSHWGWFKYHIFWVQDEKSGDVFARRYVQLEFKEGTEEKIVLSRPEPYEDFSQKLGLPRLYHEILCIVRQYLASLQQSQVLRMDNQQSVDIVPSQSTITHALVNEGQKAANMISQFEDCIKFVKSEEQRLTKLRGKKKPRKV